MGVSEAGAGLECGVSQCVYSVCLQCGKCMCTVDGVGWGLKLYSGGGKKLGGVGYRVPACLPACLPIPSTGSSALPD